VLRARPGAGRAALAGGESEYGGLVIGEPRGRESVPSAADKGRLGRHCFWAEGGARSPLRMADPEVLGGDEIGALTENRTRTLAVQKSANNWLVMASKKIQTRMKSVERMDVKLKQLTLRLDQAKKALGVDERRERVGELCAIGGDFLSVGLGKLKPNERLGAFMILAEKVESESFREECRSRATAEMDRRQQCKDIKKEAKRRKRRKTEIAVESIESVAPQSTPSAVPMPPPVSSPKEALVVRFSGPITGLGQRLKSLGLRYDWQKEEWRGCADRAAVEAEISTSPYAQLLVDILPPAPSALKLPTASATGWWPQLRNDDIGEVEIESCL
jgi:hypothetical protein